MSKTSEKPLWLCPQCGKKLVIRNMWHSCTNLTEDQFFQGKSDHVKKLYREFKKFLRKCGPFHVDVAKTRISFQTRVRFAGVHGGSKDFLIVGFWLKRKVYSPCFTWINSPMPNNWVYKLRINDSKDLNRELLGWLKEAYQVGQQKFKR